MQKESERTDPVCERCKRRTKHIQDNGYGASLSFRMCEHCLKQANLGPWRPYRPSKGGDE